MHLYLPEVGVPAILVIGQHSDLDKKGSDRASASIPRRDVHPTCGLVQVNGLQFLKVVEAAANPHRDPIGRIALVELIVRVDAYTLHRGFAAKLDIYKVRLWPIRLPIRVEAVVS